MTAPVITPAVGFVGGGIGLAVAWSMWPALHPFLVLLVLILAFGIYLSHATEIGSQFTAVMGWNGTKAPV